MPTVNHTHKSRAPAEAEPEVGMSLALYLSMFAMKVLFLGAFVKVDLRYRGTGLAAETSCSRKAIEDAAAMM